MAHAVVESTDARQGKAKGLKRTFSSVSGVAAQLTGAQIVELARQKGILAITPDSKIRLSAANGGFSSNQTWVSAVAAPDVWSGTLRPPAIAVVDSGVQACRADFSDTGAGCSTRVVAKVTMTNLLPNSSGDGRGHGTLVAGLAAGSRDGYAGVAPTAPIVSIDVMDDNGMAMTSDVIAAADWILANKSALQHPRRELLAAVDGLRQLHVRPARQGGREALVQRRGRRRGRRQLRRRTASRPRWRTRRATIPS